MWRAARILPIVKSETLPDEIALSSIIKRKSKGISDWNEEVDKSDHSIYSNQISRYPTLSAMIERRSWYFRSRHTNSSVPDFLMYSVTRIRIVAIKVNESAAAVG